MIKKIIKYFWKSTPFLNYFYPDPKRLKQVSFKKWFLQKILGINRKAYWPTHFTTVVSNPKNILIGKGTLPGGSPGCYIQGIGKIKMGKYVFVGPNVGIISANHDIYDVRKHNKGEVEIGDYSWIGMNSVILPGSKLGNHTIVHIHPMKDLEGN